MGAAETAAYLIGVDHRIQYTNAGCGPEWTLDIQRFEDYLVERATTLDVDLLAEEFSDEAARLSNATHCTVGDAARRAGRGHLYMDPDTAERAEAGISTDDQREQEWLRRLRGFDARRPLIVCGNGHVDSFAARLGAAGFRVSVLSCNWGNDGALKD